MTDIQTFTQQILNRKEQECQKHQKHVEQQLQEQLAQAVYHIERDEQIMREKIKKELQLQETIAKQQLKNDKRNTVLQHKQDSVQKLFDIALSTMKNWQLTEFAQFLYAVLKQFDAKKTYTIYLGEHSPFTLRETTSSLEEILEHAILQTEITLPHYIKIGQEIIQHEAGFILEDSGIRYNYLFASLIREVQQDYMSTLLQQLVEE